MIGAHTCTCNTCRPQSRPLRKCTHMNSHAHRQAHTQRQTHKLTAVASTRNTHAYMDRDMHRHAHINAHGSMWHTGVHPCVDTRTRTDTHGHTDTHVHLSVADHMFPMSQPTEAFRLLPDGLGREVSRAGPQLKSGLPEIEGWVPTHHADCVDILLRRGSQERKD